MSRGPDLTAGEVETVLGDTQAVRPDRTMDDGGVSDCPFCHSSGAALFFDGMSVCCHVCGAKGPDSGLTQADSIALWNKRGVPASM